MSEGKRIALEMFQAVCPEVFSEIATLRAEVEQLRRERDEAHADLTAIAAALGMPTTRQDVGAVLEQIRARAGEYEAMRAERDEAWAELAKLNPT